MIHFPATTLSPQAPPRAASTPDPLAPEKKKAYEEFEALLLGDVLKNLRGSLGGSWLGKDAGAGEDAILEMAEQQMVKVMASQDVLGIVRSLEKKL
jgi:hypothetical protein